MRLKSAQVLRAPTHESNPSWLVLATKWITLLILHLEIAQPFFIDGAEDVSLAPKPAMALKPERRD